VGGTAALACRDRSCEPLPWKAGGAAGSKEVVIGGRFDELRRRGRRTVGSWGKAKGAWARRVSRVAAADSSTRGPHHRRHDRSVKAAARTGANARVLVTDGAGFIGARVCRALAAAAAKVVVLDDLSTGSAENLAGLPVELRVGSVLEPGVLSEAAAGTSSILHLAAQVSVQESVADPVASLELNASGTLHVLESARRQGSHVVIASSAAVYGDDPSPRKSESLAPRPRSPYAAGKLAAEAYGAAYAACYGLPVLVLRFFNVYGPCRPGSAYAAVVPAFVSAAEQERPAADLRGRSADAGLRVRRARRSSARHCRDHPADMANPGQRRPRETHQPAPTRRSTRSRPRPTARATARTGTARRRARVRGR
jgi:NAD dependent epimerase/dehydratase family